MPAVQDYLDITVSDARRQWRSILARQPVSGRQVDFRPVETILCLGASLLINHRRYGGSTAEQAGEPVPSLARLFVRRNSSILAKMANLDGSRRNGAKYEVEVGSSLLADRGRLALVYRVAFAAARMEGIGADQLPDFLQLEGHDESIVLLGQDELDRDAVDSLVEEELAQWLGARDDLDPEVTERLLLEKVRVDQHRFAAGVLANHGHRCIFCGLDLRFDERRAARMLVASHIKPWRESSNRERLDISNGLCACPTHDVAFDTGLISVSSDLAIQIKPVLVTRAAQRPEVAAAFGRPPLAERLLLPDGAIRPKARYLDFHRENIYAAP